MIFEHRLCIKENTLFFRKITPVCAMFILNLVISNPSIYLHEIQASVEKFLWIDVSISTIGHFLSSSGFSRQKLCHVALQRDAFERARYVSDVYNIAQLLKHLLQELLVLTHSLNSPSNQQKSILPRSNYTS